MVFPSGSAGKEPACPCRRCKSCEFDPWVGKIPWRHKWQATPVFWPWKILWTEGPTGPQSMGLVTKSWTQLSPHACTHTSV